MASKRGGVQRVLAKLNASVEQGNYYEAHQMYRTLYFRYNNQEKFQEAIDLLYDGAVLLLKHNQQTSGVDLALLLIDTLQKSKFDVTQENIEKLGVIHELIAVDLAERPNYVAQALKWSVGRQREASQQSGHPDLHRKFAVTLWHERNYPSARYHFVRSSDGEGCAHFLIEHHIVAGYPSEVDLFIAQAVLQYLCLRNKNSAELVFKCYTRKHPQVEDGPPYIRPLLNFLWLLLLAIEGGKVAVFTILCEEYQPSLKRDPTYNDYLDRIGQLFFGLPPPRPTDGPGGMFGNLIQSLLGGLGEESSDEEGATGGASPSSSTSKRNRLQQLSQDDLD